MSLGTEVTIGTSIVAELVLEVRSLSFFGVTFRHGEPLTPLLSSYQIGSGVVATIAGG